MYTMHIKMLYNFNFLLFFKSDLLISIISAGALTFFFAIIFFKLSMCCVPIAELNRFISYLFYKECFLILIMLNLIFVYTTIIVDL